jgi:hypothetical protein
MKIRKIVPETVLGANDSTRLLASISVLTSYSITQFDNYLLQLVVEVTQKRVSNSVGFEQSNTTGKILLE